MNINEKEKRILAIVVTYYPEKELLYCNISAFIDYVDKVLIWENTPRRDSESYRYINDEKVEYCGDGVNSISHALNYAWHYAKDNGYDYLLTMDQDSVWVNFSDFLNKTIYNPNAPYGLYGPTIDDGVNDRSYDDDFHCHDIITSGMLIPINLLNEIGGYGEFLKIDGVDFYLCYRAMELGYGVYTVKNCFLKQQFGNYGFAKFLNHSFTTYRYSATRLYEIYKSQIIMLRRFHTTEEFRRNFWKNRMIKWPFKILFGEDDKVNKFKAIIKGIFAGLFFNLKECR